MRAGAVISLPEETRTLGSRVYERLRDDIVSGRLAPGRKLTLDVLKEQYGVGVTPLREALYRLSTSLLVIAEDQRGFRVAPVSAEHLSDILMSRQHIETLVLRDAFEHGDLSWESRILSALHQLKRTPMYVEGGASVTPAWNLAHQGFHDAILSAARSPMLLHFQKMLWDHAARYRNIVRHRGLGDAALLVEHEALSAAILSRDQELACLLLRRHIAGASDRLLEGVRQLGKTI